MGFEELLVVTDAYEKVEIELWDKIIDEKSGSSLVQFDRKGCRGRRIACYL